MFAVIFVPDFSLQTILRHEPELRARPVALLDDETKTRVLQLNEIAREAGVVAGMTPTQARARCAAVTFCKRSSAQEKIAGEILLQTAQSISPFVEATAEGIVTIDLRSLRLGSARGSRVGLGVSPRRTLH